MPWECSRCPREGGAGVDPAENVGCECAGAPGPGVLGQVGSLLLAGDGWTGRCFGAWLLHGRWKLCFVFLDDVRNVTRLVCFPSLTEPASHLVDQPAGHLQGVCKMDTHQRESCWRVGQGLKLSSPFSHAWGKGCTPVTDTAALIINSALLCLLHKIPTSTYWHLLGLTATRLGRHIPMDTV